MSLINALSILEKGYELYLNNLSNSPTLFDLLMVHKTYTVGIVRANRKFMPSDFPNRVKCYEHSNWPPVLEMEA